MLRKLKSTEEADFNIFSLDSEDSEGKTYVWCLFGVLTDGTEISKVFYDPKEVVEYLFKTRHPRTILTGVNLMYDTNTLRYRRGYTWEEITCMGRLITAFPSKADIDKYMWGKRSNAIRIIDLGNFIQNTSLKGMCDMFKIEGHIDKHVLGEDGSKDEMIEACMSHARSGVKVFQALQAQLHLIGAHIKLTSSSTAMDLYRRKFLTEEGEIWDCVKETGGMLDQWREGDAEDKEARSAKVEYMKTIGKSAYVGGRCENFSLGRFENQRYLDINSSYPHQMHERVFPDMNSYRSRNGDLGALVEYMKDFEGEARVTVKAPKKLIIPFLHHKMGEEGKLMFPLGTFEGWYTFPELRKAISIGYDIIDVHEIAIFNRTQSPFKLFVDQLMVLKREPATKLVAKLLMNGLSGKFGEMSHETGGWRPITEGEVIPPEEVVYLQVSTDEEPQAWTRDDLVNENDSNFADRAYPLIIAYITAWGRIQEYETMEVIGFKHVHYMDTDSIIADKEAVDAAITSGNLIINPKMLGAYDLEHELCTVEIRGLKYYRLQEAGSDEWVYHIKGVPSRYSVEYWENRKAMITGVVKQKTALRSGQRVNKFYTSLREDKVERDNKRIFEPEQEGKTQYSSKPFIIG